jgi:glucan 1,3-beta-glucosidase
VTIVFHDGFRINEWVGFFTEPDFTNIVVDTHMYLMHHTLAAGHRDLDDYLTYIDNKFARTLKEMSEHFPVIVGEWCLDTSSSKAAALSTDERFDYYRRVAGAQFKAWRHAVGCIYWSYKLLVETPESDVWDMSKAMELGYLPADVHAYPTAPRDRRIPGPHEHRGQQQLKGSETESFSSVPEQRARRWPI